MATSTVHRPESHCNHARFAAQRRTDFLSFISTAIHAALKNARGSGELRRTVDPRKEAALFTAFVLAMFVMLRAKAPTIVLEHAARVAIEQLEGLRPGRLAKR